MIGTATPVKAHPVDIAAILAYLAGIGGYTTILTGLVSQDNHFAHTLIIIISSISFFAGLALRVWFNQTPPGQPPENSTGVTP